MPNPLEVSHLSFAYDKKPILNDITFSLPQGSVTVLLGANGAGKSTLIKLIAGVLKSKTGEISLFGKSKSDYSSKNYASLVAYVPQKPLFQSASVVDALLIGRLPLFTAPSKNDYTRVYECIEELGLQELAMKDVLCLSGGEQQKVAVARAFTTEASLLVLDEPTANLDLKNRYEIIRLIQRTAAAGKTVLVSMHDVNEALDLGDRFLTMQKGGIVDESDKADLSEEVLSKTYGLSFHKVEHDGKIHFHVKGE